MLAALAAALWLSAFAVVHDHHALAQLNVAQLNVQPPQAGHQLTPQPPPQAQPQPPQPAPQAAPKKDGFFDAVGRWWDQSAADFDANLKKMKTQIEEANDRNAKTLRDVTQGAATATKEATDALSKLPSTRIIEGRERCLLAPNGSPDCGQAAETLCKAKGFKSGASANIESARKCSARAFLSRDEKDCVNETIVTRAACQ
jgi:hypothetical protein